MQGIPLRLRALGLCLALAAALAACVRTDLPQAQARDIQQVVKAQLEAFAANDANKAFALADPVFRSRYENPQQFLAMVQTQYPMVQRATSVRFLKPEGDSQLVVQRVHLADPTGITWMATYFLQKQQDQQWRISACVVVADHERVLA